MPMDGKRDDPEAGGSASQGEQSRPVSVASSTSLGSYWLRTKIGSVKKIFDRRRKESGGEGETADSAASLLPHPSAESPTTSPSTSRILSNAAADQYARDFTRFSDAAGDLAPDLVNYMTEAGKAEKAKREAAMASTADSATDSVMTSAAQEQVQRVASPSSYGLEGPNRFNDFAKKVASEPEKPTFMSQLGTAVLSPALLASATARVQNAGLSLLGGAVSMKKRANDTIVQLWYGPSSPYHFGYEARLPGTSMFGPEKNKKRASGSITEKEPKSAKMHSKESPENERPHSSRQP